MLTFFNSSSSGLIRGGGGGGGGVEKGVFPSIRERQQRKHQKRNWLVSNRGELGTSPCIFGIRAAPRNYQLDAEIGKKWPGLKLSQNKAYGT